MMDSRMQGSEEDGESNRSLEHAGHFFGRSDIECFESSQVSLLYWGGSARGQTGLAGDWQTLKLSMPCCCYPVRETDAFFRVASSVVQPRSSRKWKEGGHYDAKLPVHCDTFG